MDLSDLFELGETQIQGREYGWVNTRIDVHPGMPLEIQGSGSINFCNVLGMQYWFTPDGEAGKPAMPESLGYGVPGVRHAMMIGRIGNGPIFPVGSFLHFQSYGEGPLLLAHNDTKDVNDNDGAWTARVYIPVVAINGQRRAPGNPAFDVQFSGPWGINGQLTVNLPNWIQHPAPHFSMHEGPAHGTDPQHGLFCVATEIPIWGPIRFNRCLHIQL